MSIKLRLSVDRREVVLIYFLLPPPSSKTTSKLYLLKVSIVAFLSKSLVSYCSAQLLYAFSMLMF